MSSKPNKYTPHQGKKEKARRLKQLEKISVKEPAP